MDFGSLPPEINSARMYSGAGSASMLTAATAWDGLAHELQSTAAVYGSVLTDLASTAWQGPSSAAMAAAATPYVQWMNATAAQAEQSAFQARAAAGAYEAAFSATVPPPVVAANRTLLATLVATNFLGQNAPAIAATDAHYAEMWAQDAAAMYGYAASSAAATQLTSFTEPPRTTSDKTNGNAAASQSAANATHLLSQVPNTLQNLTTNPSSWSAAVTEASSDLQTWMNNTTNFLKTIDGPYSPLGVLRLFKNWWQVSSSLTSMSNGGQSLVSFFNPKPITGALAPLLGSELLTGASAVHPAGVSSAVSGAIGRAGVVGSLSVPASWASAAPAVKTMTTVLPAAVANAVPAMAVTAQDGMFGQMALSSLAGRAFAAPVSRAVGGAATRTIGAVTRVANSAVAPDIATTATIIVIPPIGK
ncbi:MAG TPA: PPE family protein [Mycobacterium sp.]|nr:PPE family protein [Mycobacterium sp.]